MLIPAVLIPFFVAMGMIIGNTGAQLSSDCDAKCHLKEAKRLIHEQASERAQDEQDQNNQ
jgi:hypothetical protein